MNNNDQLGKALKELKRDIEFAYVGQDNAGVTGTSSVAREMDSASQLIANTIAGGSAGAASGGSHSIVKS